jgi:hypothetical protein
MLSRRPDRSPRLTTWISSGGNRPDRSSGSASGLPAVTCSSTASIADVSAVLPRVFLVMRSA